ncbi:MAG: hypothetical protein B7C24_02195 [Bacteroidetes bacterium 4572_77]|nr:MAG: hypothetical protein B7C24_02195 [Bacteroidetes bacterium 4572_77]
MFQQLSIYCEEGFEDRKFYRGRDGMFPFISLGIQYDVFKSIIFSINTGMGFQKTSGLIAVGGLLVADISLGFKF